MIDQQQIIRELAQEIKRADYIETDYLDCIDVKTLRNALTLLKAHAAFKECIDTLYGIGLDVVGWHENGALEPFDNFYESAIKEYESGGGTNG